jgi:hypothetical protein
LALPDVAPGPLGHHRVALAAAAAHLKEGGKHEKGQHREDRDGHEERSLVLAEDVERAGHGTT